VLLHLKQAVAAYACHLPLNHTALHIVRHALKGSRYLHNLM